MKRIVREITPINDSDLFIVLNHYNAKFDFPVHYHPEYEINLVLNASGKRVVGDSIKTFGHPDLVLIGPNTPHAWTGEETEDAHVITIQFQQDFLSEKTLSRNIFNPINDMMERSRMGIHFSEEFTLSMVDRISQLTQFRGFDSFLNFLSILYDMSTSRNQSLLSSPNYVDMYDTSKSKKITLVNEYLSKNLQHPIKFEEVASLVNMSPSAFSHFFKKRTQRTFSNYLSDLRIGHSAKLLIETDKNISEVCYESGFNNLSNFNRVFRKQKGCTPKEFRMQQKLITKH
ncbi:AraC family transcriptional regulator [Zobellia galactanivorans]|uniref:AraC-type transcriptional regulator n=2 Tax=Zobellia TaxID=112040 RepID=G0L911_ZOBGA|nr:MULTISPECIES: AraC family transcriptional regulator [Zobellia]MDO6519331.1 AraC family transcriptional regulator [Zobellia uliginosa]MDO6809919.1 AraC family transcriptional regulator [Zobellia galactanivorans]CAZ94299.1 AraC-type transcriptional regulator [Zobellia galactanivorans]SIT08324.1 AraC-type DNA-binding protein [Zobellia uliginosa]